MDEGLNFSRLGENCVFLWNGRYLRKIAPVPVGQTRRGQTKYHNCQDANTGETMFLYAFLTVLPVEFKEVRADGRLLFKYAAEYNLIEIKPKGQERPLLVKLN